MWFDEVAKEKSVLEVVEKRKREWLVKEVRRKRRTVKYLSEHSLRWLIEGSKKGYDLAKDDG